MSSNMEQSLRELGEACEHAAGRLSERPADRHGLVDVATVVLLVSSRLRRWVSFADPDLGRARQLAASGMALTAVERHLRRLGDSGNDAPVDEVRRTIDVALHLVVRVLDVLQGTASDSPALDSA